MNPVLAGLTANDSGAVKEDLIAADGTIIYSGTPGMAGLHEPPEEQWMLDEALAGRVTTMLEEAPYDPGARPPPPLTIASLMCTCLSGWTASSSARTSWMSAYPQRG